MDDKVKNLLERVRGTASYAAVTKLLAQADEKAAKIAELKNRIADLKQAASCPACGESCGRGDKFCRQCGAPLC